MQLIEHDPAKLVDAAQSCLRLTSLLEEELKNISNRKTTREFLFLFKIDKKERY